PQPREVSSSCAARSCPTSTSRSWARQIASSPPPALEVRSNACSRPASVSASGSRASAPATATTGSPAARARRATSAGPLPCRVCSSSLPSPVMTSSARARSASKPASSSTASAPERCWAPSRNRAKPVPPAAPAPSRPGGAPGGAGQQSVDLRHLPGPEALLGPVDGGGPIRAQQRIGDVVGGDQGGAVEGLQGGCEICGGEFGQALGAGCDLLPPRGQQA